jgi:hypothetical protein
MKFEPGKDQNGRTPLLDDGLPAFAVCGYYYISRAKTSRGYLSDAWYRPSKERMAEQLEGGVTARQAKKACEDHAHGLPAQVD